MRDTQRQPLTPARGFRYEQRQALSRLVKLITRRRNGTVEATDAALLERLREVIDFTESGFARLLEEINSYLDEGWVWNSRYRIWRWPKTSVRGRPPQPGFMRAWKMAEEALRGSLGREPSRVDVADHLRREPTLRLMAGVGRWTKVKSLARRHKRRSRD